MNLRLPELVGRVRRFFGLHPKLSLEDMGFRDYRVVAVGLTGPQWLNAFECKGIPVSVNARGMLLSNEFTSTPAGTVINVVVIDGRSLEGTERVTEKIISLAMHAGLARPPVDLGPHLRMMLSDQEIRSIGLEKIVTFSRIVEGRFFDIVTERGNLESAPASQSATWHSSHGFAFESTDSNS